MAHGHDQLFKEIIAAFAAAFVRLVLPDLAARIDPGRLRLRSEQHFADSPHGGKPRRPDLVALVFGSADPQERALLHVEIEARFRARRLPRLFDYNRLLSLRHALPVHTVVVYLRGGPTGVADSHYRLVSLGRAIVVFTYTSFGLSGAMASDYLAQPEPIGWAFAALMRPGSFGTRAARRVACLRRIVSARSLSENQSFLLFNFVATYIQSEKEASEEYEELFERDDNQEVRQAMMTWAETIEAKGFAAGRQEGRQENVRTLRQLVLRLLGRRFGATSARLEARIGRIDSPEELTRLAEEVSVADSLASLELDDSA